MAVNDIPPYLKTQNTAKSDLTQVLTTRALAWSLYRNQLVRSFTEVLGTTYVDGIKCFNADTAIGYQAGIGDSDTQNMLEMMGATKQETLDIRLAKDDSDVDEVWMSFKKPVDDLTIERADEIYSDIISKMSDVAKVELTGVTNTYDSLTTPRPVSVATTIDNHNSRANWINESQDSYNGINLELPTGDVQIPIEDLDGTLTATFYDASDVDITPTDTRLVEAVKALLLLEQDRFGTLVSTVNAGEVLVGDTYQVSATITYDTTSLDSNLDMSKFIHIGTQQFTEVLVDENESTTRTAYLWKNYFWLHGTAIGLDQLASVSGGILLGVDWNNKVYLTVEGLEKATTEEFEQWIVTAYNIRVETRDLKWWEKILTAIAQLFGGIYELIYQVLRAIPYFALKEDQLIDWLVKYGKPFSGDEFTQEEAEIYMHEVGIKAIGITISIILIVFSGFDWTSLGTILADIGEAVVFFGLPAIAQFLAPFLLQAVNMGLMLYNSYIGVETEFEEWQIEEAIKKLEAEQSELIDEASKPVELATAGTMGDVSSFSLQNHIMYEASYNEFFEIRLENVSPFDYGGEYTTKYKQGE